MRVAWGAKGDKRRGRGGGGRQRGKLNQFASKRNMRRLTNRKSPDIGEATERIGKRKGMWVGKAKSIEKELGHMQLEGR